MLTSIKFNFAKALLVPVFLGVFSAPAFAEEKYNLDPDHSYITWSVDHFGFSRVSGKVFAEGNIVIDDKKPQSSKIDVTIPISKLSTGIAHLDHALASSGFFDSAQFPNAYFKSAKITIKGENAGTVSGILTIRNISKPIVMTITLNKQGAHPYHDNKKAIGFSAKGTIKRSEYGMTAYLPSVGDEVMLDLEGEAILENTPKK
jgi:polyisoprenoid-binding protein YceI